MNVSIPMQAYNLSQYCSNLCEFNEAVLGRISIMIVINVLAMAYLVITRKLVVHNKIDESWWTEKADWGLIALLVSSLWLLELVIRGF